MHLASSRSPFAPSLASLLLCWGVALSAPLTIGCGQGCEDQPEDQVDLSPTAIDTGGDMALEDSSSNLDSSPHQDAFRDDLFSGVDSGRDQADMRVVNPFDLSAFDFGDPDANQDLKPLAIVAVAPPRGPLSGATPFSIVGEGFTPNTRVFFGSAPADTQLVDGVLVGETPPGAGAGPVTVRLLDPDQGSASLLEGFTYFPTLELERVEPDRLPTTGLIEVEVIGQGFDETTRVSFGGRTALRHTLVDPTLLRVLAPPHPAGAVTLRATNRDASAQVPEAATYFERLEIHSATPPAGGVAGGERVTLIGRGFEEGMQIFFDGRLAVIEALTLRDDDPDELTVVAPAAPSAGWVDVSALSADSEAALAQDLYLYVDDQAALSVARLDPASGPLSGGQRVTFVGPGLDDPALTITFDGAPAAVVEQGIGYLVALTPAGAALGAVDVLVGALLLPDAYVYKQDFSLKGIAPDTGSVNGGDVAVILGEGLLGVTEVEFGGLMASSFMPTSQSALDVVTPAHPPAVVDVTVHRGQDIEVLQDAFEFAAPSRLDGFSPARGSVAGGTYVVFRGEALGAVSAVRFDGEAASELELLDTQTLAVKTPPALAPGRVAVTLELEDGSTLDAAEEYLYFNPGARFGGAWGGSVQGAVNVTVYSQGGGPLEDAFVMLSTREDTAYQGFTDVNGQITLSGPDVYGEQSVTAVAAGHSVATVQSFDAENITVFLTPPPNPGEPPPGAMPATFRGRLTGLNKLAEAGPAQFPMAILATTQVSARQPNPNPGSGATLLNDGDYEITTRLGDLAIVAIGGLYDNITQTFEPLRMGVARYQFASEAMIYEDVDIDLNIPLDASITVKMNNPPAFNSIAGPNGVLIETTMNFGFEGIFKGLPPVERSNAQSLLSVNHLAEPSGELLGVSYLFEAGVYTHGGGAPLSVGVLKPITALNQLYPVDLLDVARVTAPAEGARPLNNLIAFEYASSDKPDLYYVRVQTFMQATRWEGFLPGDATSLQLPQFPDFSSLPPDQRPVPYGNEPLVLLIVGIKQPGLTVDQFTYSNLDQAQWTAYSIAVRTITL